MKIFNVCLRVTISQIGYIPDEPPDTKETSEPFNDDPLDKQEKMMNKYLDRAASIFGDKRPAAYFPDFPGGDGPEGATMTRNIKIAAESFEELQAILTKFNETAKQLVAVPDSLFSAHAQQSFTPMG